MFLEEISHQDILEWARQSRPNSKWVVVCVTNMTLFVNKMPDYPIGCPEVHLPDYIKYNKAIIGLEMNKNTHKHYEDKLCFFRAVALHHGCSVDAMNKRALYYFHQIIGEDADAKTFEGVSLMELATIEEKIQSTINVYQLIEIEDSTIQACLVHRSHRRYPDKLNLNLFEDHFSYITNLGLYSKSYACRSCGKLWKLAGQLHRHEQHCEHSTRRVCVGGFYQPPKTVFEELENEGIHVP